jgi:Glycosyl hydrolase family 9
MIAPGTTRLLTNHLGVEQGADASLVLEAPAPLPAAAFQVRGPDGGKAGQGELEPLPPVPGWTGRHHARLRLPAVPGPGPFVVEVALPGDPLRSAPIEASRKRLTALTFDAVLGHLRAMRSRDPWDSADRQAPFFGGRRDRVDVHGGYHDASGDVSKYLSHLSYANFMNPQQAPIVTWAVLHCRDQLPAGNGADGRRQALVDEAAHGADFLCRMLDPAGYFYMTVFDRWSKQIEQREICSYKTQQGIKLDKVQAGFRQGGGVAIAALARAAGAGAAGDFSSADYLDRARIGFAHLQQHNREYLDDGQENILDDYCALLAATELYAAAGERAHRDAAAERAQRLASRVADGHGQRGYWKANGAERPFFHAVEAGLPAVALLRWLDVGDPGDQDRRAVEQALERSLAGELALTAEVSNPFGYARQLVQPLEAPVRSSFFFPHQNESGYWWQGENARLASLATAAAEYARRYQGDGNFGQQLRRYARDQLDWILGRNPFDTCMLHGFGRNNVEYSPQWRNVAGGICNGITGGWHDEHDVEFLRTDLPGDQTWRWSEQWIPHAAWYLLAVSALDR